MQSPTIARTPSSTGTNSRQRDNILTSTKSRQLPRIARRALFGALLAGTLFMSGCLEGSFERTGIYLPPKHSSAPIDIYIDAAPAAPYIEVGRVSAEGNYWGADFDSLMLVLKSQARQLGADAVILTESWTEEAVYYDDYGYEHYRTVMFANGIAIHFP